MRCPQSDHRLERVLISETRLRKRIRELAQAIVHDSDPARPLRLVAILKGAFVFAADLGREIRRCGGPPVRYDFIRAVTYGTTVGNGDTTDRQVRIEWAPDTLAGEDVVLVEDILDQGRTLAHVRDLLLGALRARSVRLCVLLDKRLDSPSPAVAARRQALPVDYVGFTIADRWVAGYGLDAAEEFRDLPFIAIVREEFFVNAP